MNTADLPGVTLRYRIDGRADAPWLVLSNSLGTTLEMWDPQVEALAPRFRILRYDSRGHGASSTTPGPYSIAQLGRDVLDLMGSLGIARAHFCGLSMGGMVGQWLGVHAPGQVDRLVLCNTAARIGPAEVWNTRIARVREGGMASIADMVIARWFSAAFIAQGAPAIERTRAALLAMPADGYVASCAAVRDMDQRADVARIAAPTLVIAGRHDLVTTPADCRWLAGQIPGARYVELDAAHISNLEREADFTRALADFLTA